MTNRREFLKIGAVLAAGGISGMKLTGTAEAIEPVSRTGNPIIRVGCAAYSYRKYLSGKDANLNLERFLEIAAEIGCDGVEMTSYYFPPDADIAYINNLKRKAFLLGLDISSTSVGNKFTVPAGEERSAQIALVKKWINHSSEIGAPCIRIFAGTAPKDTSDEEAIKWVVECIHECLDLAAQRGVILALENHGGVTSNADNMLSILKGADSKWVGALLDTGNFRTEDPYKDIEMIAPYAITTHFKVDVRPAGKEFEKADIKRIVGMLNKAGFRGYLTLEYETAEDPMTAVPRLIREMKTNTM